MEKNKIILTADCNLVDMELREHVSRLEQRIENINRRTKNYTTQIRDLEKEIKKLKGKGKKEKVKGYNPNHFVEDDVMDRSATNSNKKAGNQ